MQARVDIAAGVCGHMTSAHAVCGDMRHVSFSIETDCENVRRLAVALDAKGELEAHPESSPRSENTVLAAAREVFCCPDCIVPPALLKGLRVAAGLARPEDIAVALGVEEPGLALSRA
jgi:hypothetical protein